MIANDYNPYRERVAFMHFAGIRKKRILDVGAGKGISSLIAAKGFENEVAIIDPHADQISNARHHIGKYGLEGMISFIEADIADSFLEDGSFDYVICFNAFHHIPDDSRIPALEEMYRIGKNGLVISELNKNGVPVFDTQVHPGSGHKEKRVNIPWLEIQLQKIGRIKNMGSGKLNNFYHVY